MNLELDLKFTKELNYDIIDACYKEGKITADQKLNLQIVFANYIFLLETFIEKADKK